MEEKSKPLPAILRIGILGAANIARKNVKAIQHPTNRNHCKLVAIASRSETKAIQFLNDHVATTSTEDQDQADDIKLYTGPNAYLELINDDTIDAVYIPLPTTLHLKYVKQALIEGDKHVLVEKPVAASHIEYREMINAATMMKKYLMDGTMFVHNPRTNDVCSFSTAINGKDGSDSTSSNDDPQQAVTRIQSDFTFLGDDTFFTKNIRVSSNGDMLGCIGDLGWYCIRMAQLIFKESSSSATFAQVTHHELNEHGVPIDATCLVTFENSEKRKKQRVKVLSFHCSFIHPLTQTITLHGLEQAITLDDFVIPREEGVQDISLLNNEKEKTLTFEVHSQELSHADLYSIHSNEIKKSSKCKGSPQEVLMWNNFAKFCRAFDSEDDGDVKQEGRELQAISYDNQCIIDALFESILQDGRKVPVHSNA